ncbi:MAG: hypothetical protein AAF488_11595 [Planctomycetota bacterium]
MKFDPPDPASFSIEFRRLLLLTLVASAGLFAVTAALSTERALSQVTQDPPAPADPPTAPVKTDLDAGQKAFTSCGGCHGRPDAKLATDKLWIDRVAVTACVQPAGRPSAPTRASIIAYLESERDVPRLVSTAAKPAAGEGEIQLGHPEKLTVLLVPMTSDGSTVDAERDPIRLAWGPDQGEEKRALPAGLYRVRHYTIRRNDQSGEEWHLWGSGPAGRRVHVDAGGSTKLLLDPRVQCRLTAKQTANGVGIGLAVTGDGGLGATVIQKDKRVPVKYRLIGNGVVGKGVLPYG